MPKGAAQNKERELLKVAPHPSPCTYLCEWNSPYFVCPPDFALIDPSAPSAGGGAGGGKQPVGNAAASPAPAAKADAGKAGAAAGGSGAAGAGASGPGATTKFNMTLTPKGAGTYPCALVLQSAYDVRVYAVEVEVLSPGTQVWLIA